MDSPFASLLREWRKNAEENCETKECEAKNTQLMRQSLLILWSYIFLFAFL
jgi:hypothetical protein